MGCQLSSFGWIIECTLIRSSSSIPSRMQLTDKSGVELKCAKNCRKCKHKLMNYLMHCGDINALLQFYRLWHPFMMVLKPKARIVCIVDSPKPVSVSRFCGMRLIVFQSPRKWLLFSVWFGLVFSTVFGFCFWFQKTSSANSCFSSHKRRYFCTKKAKK